MDYDLQELRNRCNPQMLWSSYKEAILAASELATQTRRAERLKLRRQADKGIRRAERDLRDCAPTREEECRKILSDRRKTLNDYEEEARNNRTHLNEAKWFTNNERMSKQWFSLNKVRTTGTDMQSNLCTWMAQKSKLKAQKICSKLPGTTTRNYKESRP